MSSYDQIRQTYRPDHLKVLLVAESPPPRPDTNSSRHFYRTDKIRKDDRLFVNTIKALYPEAIDMAEADLERNKKQWLKRFQFDGWYMIEALEQSLPHEVTKKERQALIKAALPQLLERVGKLAAQRTKIILIKSNVFDVAAEPLRQAGHTVLNEQLLDYPGQFNQRAFREKLSSLAAKV